MHLETLCFCDKATAKLQHRILSRHYIGCAPAFFVHVDFAKSIGGYDERFPTIEDSPFYLRITGNNCKLYLLPKVVVHQRVHLDSISNSREDDSFISNSEVRNVMVYHDLYHYENSSCFWKRMSKIYQHMTEMVVKYGNSKKSRRSRFYYYIRKWFNPYKFDLVFLMTVNKLLSITGQQQSKN